MRRWNPVLIAALLLLSGCASLEWMVSRVATVLPQERVVPAPTYAAEIPTLATGGADHAERTETRPSTLDAPRPIVEEDWPVMVLCGLG